ncbi:protoglobin domain-containing protein [Ensifer psoraleae]|uniref:Protoglobin domain-containing protein n=1 Tax=Sinorhizobium psoraleae TaxID=520838 RepID=A0ABT4KE95_9HYPH|nr:protoglobin domain-containing protein [Sinorhizobium psoraleae]MCZ4090209.1 protoglobin domain-containing protein [Sinorhizobium psoraleae]
MSTDGSQNTSLKDRLDFVGLNDLQRQSLMALAPTINASLDGALDLFYAKVRNHPETAKFFSGKTR